MVIISLLFIVAITIINKLSFIAIDHFVIIVIIIVIITFCYYIEFDHSLALIIQIYLQLDRLDFAKRELTATKTWAEDAMLVQLIEAWVGLKTVTKIVMIIIPKTRSKTLLIEFSFP